MGKRETQAHRRQDKKKPLYWRKDKTCQLYQTIDELPSLVRDLFPTPHAVKYSECLLFLEQQGWRIIYNGKHPKMIHTRFPEPDTLHPAQFFNKHGTKDDRWDLLGWATYIGKAYGPSR